MDSRFGALRSLSLPFGVTSGQRIVLDGDNGTISIYNAANILVGQIDASGVFTAYDPSVVSGAKTRMYGDTSTAGVAFDLIDNPPHTKAAGSILGVLGASGAPLLDLTSPGWDGGAQAQISMAGEDLSGNPPYIDLLANSGDVDARVNGVSLGRGVLPNGYQVLSTSDSARASGANTDMTVTIDANVTRLYRVHLHGQFSLGTLSVVYALDLDEDGSVVNRLGRWSTAESAASPLFANDCSVLWLPTTGTKTLTVKNSSGGTVTFAGSATNQRHFWVEDIGAR